MFEIGTTLCFAFVLDLLLGDPRYRFHPVRLIGIFVCRGEGHIRGVGLSGRGGGILLALSTVACALLAYFGLQSLFSRISPALSFLFDLFLTYSFLALGDLLRHIKPVTTALHQGDLKSARELLAMTVGRDVSVLDSEGISRAAIETLAENFVDGFLSPLFWFIVGGVLFMCLGMNPMRGALACMLLFKCASTLDSMVGYKNARYLLYGWAGARLDDLMNLAPARLSIFFLWLGALFTGLRSFEGVRVALRDRLKHESPNSAHPESFAAGALGIRLGGPTLYREGLKQKPWLGDGEGAADESHLRKAMSLIYRSAWCAMAGPMVWTAVQWMHQ